MERYSKKLKSRNIWELLFANTSSKVEADMALVEADMALVELLFREIKLKKKVKT